jgi:hypothetical protein
MEWVKRSVHGQNGMFRNEQGWTAEFQGSGVAGMTRGCGNLGHECLDDVLPLGFGWLTG